MKRLFKNFNTKQTGFTLIELLVAIAIMGILAAIVVPNVTRYIGTGSTAAARSELKIVQNAALTAMADVNLSSIPNWQPTGSTTANFGRTFAGLPVENPVGTPVLKNGVAVSVQDYLTGISVCKAKYIIFTDGHVTQIANSYVR